MLEEKDIYNIHDLFDNLDISIRKLAEISEINEVTLARIRDGKPTYSRTANKLLKVFSKIYERPFYLNRVTGINVAVSGKKKVKESQTKEVA
jgi:predicted transcriptional regulator